MQAVQVLKKLFDNYRQTTSGKLKIIDAYMLYILLTGIAQFSNVEVIRIGSESIKIVFQFLYCVLVGTFPFNSFLSGFISTITSFVLASCLRTQVNDENKAEFSHISPERAFADFIFAHKCDDAMLINDFSYPTYGAYGASAFLLAIYFCEWKTVGQYIPLWNKRYAAD
ncbi:unnamed protein product [Angiostrongylus costaricensis]|uniref:Dolichyl-diphosphooligosaccharide--protein glycosyltransferase subunit DAD1 n=1 Tax=Angiostrongylus costaricensis TaxID=334426 RepID=A0A0R3PUI6_ANGCS|nr:unnamed protein product [Angiostrongylus costaricensis]